MLLPVLVNPPAPVILTVETVVSPEPEIVRILVPVEIPPVRVNVPASDTILASAVSLIAPAKVLPSDTLLKAPVSYTHLTLPTKRIV